jgi:hypothetical protein
LRIEIEGGWPIFKIEVPRVEIEDGARDVGSISDKTLAAGVDLEENEDVDEEDVRADKSRMR